METGGLPVMLDVDLGRGLLPGLSVDLHVDLRAYAKLNLRRLSRQGEAKRTPASAFGTRTRLQVSIWVRVNRACRIPATVDTWKLET